MRMDLKAKQARKRKRLLDPSHRNATLVDIEQMLVETLNTHLDLGAAQAADERKRLRRYGIGARLDNEPHHAMLRRLVDALLTLKLLHRCRLPLGNLAPRRTRAVQPTHRAVIAAHGSIHTLLLVGNAGSKLDLVCRNAGGPIALAAFCYHRRQGIGGSVIEQAPRLGTADARTRQHGVGRHARHRIIIECTEELRHKPRLIPLRIVAPGTAEHNELNLIGRMPHLRKRRQTGAHLQIRVKAILLRTGACRLGVQIALGHAQIVGAKQAIARAWPGLGDDGNGRHARGRSARLHTQHLQQLTLQIGIDIPRSPPSRLLTFNPLVERQQTALGQIAFVGTLTARLGMYQFDERFVVHGLAATQSLEYVQDNLFHAPIVKAKAPKPISASAPSSNSASISSPRLSSAPLLRIKRHVARIDFKTIHSRLIPVIEFKIQNGLAVVAKRKEIALEVAAAQGEARLKARRVRNRHLHIARAHTHVHRLRGGLVELERYIARPDLCTKRISHAARKLYISRTQEKVETITGDTGNLQIARAHVRVDSLQMFGNTARQLNRNRAVNCLTVITSKLRNLERRVLDGCDVLRRGLGGIHTIGNVSPLDNASLVAINNLDVHRSRSDIEIEVAELIGIKSRARKLLRPSRIVTAIQGIVLVKHIVKIRQMAR